MNNNNIFNINNLSKKSQTIKMKKQKIADLRFAPCSCFRLYSWNILKEDLGYDVDNRNVLPDAATEASVLVEAMPLDVAHLRGRGKGQIVSLCGF